MTTKSMQQAIDTASTYTRRTRPEVAQASMRQTYHLYGAVRLDQRPQWSDLLPGPVPFLLPVQPV